MPRDGAPAEPEQGGRGSGADGKGGGPRSEVGGGGRQDDAAGHNAHGEGPAGVTPAPEWDKHAPHASASSTQWLWVAMRPASITHRAAATAGASRSSPRASKSATANMPAAPAGSLSGVDSCQNPPECWAKEEMCHSTPASPATAVTAETTTTASATRPRSRSLSALTTTKAPRKPRSAAPRGKNAAGWCTRTERTIHHTARRADGQRDDCGCPVLEADQGHDGDDPRHDGHAEGVGGVEAALAVDRGGQHADHESGQRRCAARFALRRISGEVVERGVGRHRPVRVSTPASVACVSSGSRELIPDLRIGDRLCARSLPLIRPSWHPSLVASGGQVTPSSLDVVPGVTPRSGSHFPSEEHGEACGAPPPSPARRCGVLPRDRHRPSRSPSGWGHDPSDDGHLRPGLGSTPCRSGQRRAAEPPGLRPDDRAAGRFVRFRGRIAHVVHDAGPRRRPASAVRVPPRPHVRPGRVRVWVRAPLGQWCARLATAAVVPGAGDPRSGRLALPRRGRPRAAVGRRRGLGRPRGGPAGLPGRPARREQRDRCSSTTPRTSSASGSPSAPWPWS